MRLMKMWQPCGAIEVIDLENDYFLIKFDDWRDVE